MTEKIGTHAIFNIYKPEGITSYGAIREIKKLTGQKKVGHLGTLDPLAEGILPIFLGKMTKLIPLFNQGDKTYQTTVYLGTTSTTLDREGEKTEVPIPESCTEETILQVLKTFEGEIEQIPPMLSAIKKDGKPLYKLARAGKEVERDPRKIQIYWIRNIQINLPEITFDVHCSKGTYIRVLAEEIGKALGTGSYLSKLIRTQCNGLFTIENSFTLDQLKKIDNFVAEDFSISPTSLLLDFHQIGNLSTKDMQQLSYGASISVLLHNIELSNTGRNSDQAVILDKSKQVIAVGSLEYSQDQRVTFKPTKVLL